MQPGGHDVATPALRGEGIPRLGPSPVRVLAVLMVAGVALFVANVWTLSLPSIDDCFYARKGIEMARNGWAFTVTINGEPNFQNPPLQFWILAASFRLFGENDFAARLPSIVMALGVMAGTWRIGRIIAGNAMAAASTAMLLLTPGFTNQARRCMMEIPLAFWVTMAVLALVEGRRRPRFLPLFGITLASAVLTKSVLGLLPLLLLGGIVVVAPAYRPILGYYRLWAAIVGGLLLGASWPIHQWLTFGVGALRSHYLVEIANRATESFSIWEILLSYPKTLFTLYEPVILPAIIGVAVIWRGRRGPAAEALAIAVWAVLPVVIYSASSARSARYVYPTLPALALCAGFWLALALPRVANHLATWVAPAIAGIVAVVFWVQPTLLARVTNVIKGGVAIRERVPSGESIPYLGSVGNYWRIANPLLYYQERSLDFASDSLAEAQRKVDERSSGMLIVDRNRLWELGDQVPPVILEDRDWLAVALETHRLPKR
jgi:4-amino-4-deoxy-L-arabinose transferase-like glycosyltransferase